MMRCGTVLVAAIVAAIACSGAKRLPSGPAPEYEKAPLVPWDSGAEKAASPQPR
jgi:hypothetical protein